MKVTVVPIIIGVLETMLKSMITFLKELVGRNRTTLLKSVRILRRILEI